MKKYLDPVIHMTIINENDIIRTSSLSGDDDGVKVPDDWCIIQF